MDIDYYTKVEWSVLMGMEETAHILIMGEQKNIFDPKRQRYSYMSLKEKYDIVQARLSMILVMRTMRIGK